MQFPNLPNAGLNRTTQQGSLPSAGSRAPKENFGNLLSVQMSRQKPQVINYEELQYFQDIEEEAKKVHNQAQEDFASLRSPRPRLQKLSGSKSIKLGQDTGRVFSPTSLKAWRNKNGFHSFLPNSQAENSPVFNRDNIIKDDFDSIPEPDKTTSYKIPDKLAELIDNVANSLGIDPNLVKAVVKAESNFNPKAVSPVGAMGLMQLMPGTAKDLGVSKPFEPQNNLEGGINYLKMMLEKYEGNLNKALAAYNWGPGNLDRYGSNGRLPRETQNYIAAVNKHYKAFSSQDADEGYFSL